MPPPSANGIGKKKIGGYELVAEVGRGAMGVVFKARESALDRDVALKMLLPRHAKDANYVQRFLREARAAGKLSHPNIVHVYDAGNSDGVYYIAMEFIDGISARRMVLDRGTLPEDELLKLAREMTSALAEAHRHNILHRDVKPDNILIDAHGSTHLADLGLACFVEAEETDGNLTQSNTALGTPHYMAPEQVKGRTLDVRSDIYSLGATLYFLASKTTPYEGGTASEVMLNVLKEQPRPLKQVAPSLSPKTAALIEKMMAKDPAKRFQSAQEAHSALDGTVSVPPAGDDAMPKVRTKSVSFRKLRYNNKEDSSPLLIWGGIGGAVLLLLGVLLFSRGGNSTKPAGAKETPKPGTAAADNSGSTEDAADRAFQKLASNASSSADPGKVIAECDAFCQIYPNFSKLNTIARIRESAKADLLRAQKASEAAAHAKDAVRKDTVKKTGAAAQPGTEETARFAIEQASAAIKTEDYNIARNILEEALKKPLAEAEQQALSQLLAEAERLQNQIQKHAPAAPAVPAPQAGPDAAQAVAAAAPDAEKKTPEPEKAVRVQPVIPKPPLVVDVSAKFKQLGWEEVKGEWMEHTKETTTQEKIYKVKDGALTVNSSTEGTVSTILLLTPETKMNIYFKHKAGREASDEAAASRKTAPGYGVKIEQNTATVFGSAAARTPAFSKEWKLNNGPYRIIVSVKNGRLDVSVNDWLYRDPRPQFQNGNIVVQISGEAEFKDPPRFMK